MKYLKYVFILVALFLIYSQCSASSKYSTNNKKNFNSDEQNTSKQNILSINEIDLLVGTPEGVSEPLDYRRNTITKDNQVDYSCFLDENGLTEDSETDIKWEDAEDCIPNENQVENQLMDLLAETEELEKTDDILYNDEEENASDSEEILN